MTATKIDWYAWHDDYEDPDSTLAHRLQWVQAQLRSALDHAPAGPIRLVGLCSGQGRDIAGVLGDHPRAADVSGVLVEIDPRNTETARRLLAEVGAQDRIAVVTGDAALTDAYADWVPADLIIAVGIFGNIVDSDIERVIAHLPGFSAPGARVLWSRGVKKADLNPAIRRWFADAAFEELGWELLDDTMGLGVHRYAGAPTPLAAGASLFKFVGYDAL